MSCIKFLLILACSDLKVNAQLPRGVGQEAIFSHFFGTKKPVILLNWNIQQTTDHLGIQDQGLPMVMWIGCNKIEEQGKLPV